MKKNANHVILCLVLLLKIAAPSAVAQDQVTPEQVAPKLTAPAQAAQPLFQQEEMEQILAPIALYPDSVVSQILMASTYPLEVVQADSWVKQNPDVTGDALTTALEEKTWDPSVKSLVNFPQVLAMMSEKIDWTQKLGDAFLAQQKEVMETIQKLRQTAKEEGNLKTTEQQVIKQEQDTIIIESPDTQVVYVPSYDPTVVYGAWPYPAYPPYSYYPPGHFPGSNLLSFGLGVAAGSAWGYAWGDCDWDGGDIDVDVDRNTNINRNIDRSRYKSEFQNRGTLEGGRGTWKHDPQNRKGVAYRDTGTAQKFNRTASPQAVQSREAFRGRAEQGRQEIARGDAAQFRERTPSGVRNGFDGTAATRDLGRADISDRGGALKGMDYGKADRTAASRGSASRQSRSASAGGGARSRSGGGGARSGGRARGGGGRR